MTIYRFAIRTAVINHYPLSKDKEEVFKSIIDDDDLSKIIEDYKENLAKNDIETFDTIKNIIVTEEGYFCATWDELDYNEI